MAMTPLRMSRLNAFLAALLLVGPLACSTLPTRGQLVMRAVRFPLRDLKLPSGMRVIVEEDKRAPVVAVVSLVGAGSASNPAGKEGIAHFVEHLTFRSRPDSKMNVWSRLARAGAGEFNAFTSLDYTLYYAAAPKEALADLLRIEGQRLRAPLAGLDPKVFEVEREVVRNELRERNETGYVGQVFTWLQQASFPAGHPYARPAIGTHESLSAITLNDARAFVRQHYRPDNITLVIVGDVDLATIDKLITEQFPPALVGEGLPLAPDKRMSEETAEPPLSPKAPMARHEAALPTPELYISWVLPRGFGAASAVQDFVRTVLQRKLRAARRVDGDIASIETQVIPGREASMLVCRVVLRQGAHPDKSAEVVLDQLFRVWDAPSGDDTEHIMRNIDFGRMRMAAISDMALEAENLVDRAVRRAELTHFNLDAQAYLRSLQAMTQLKDGNVTEFAYKYLTRERARIVYVSPQSTAVASTGTAPVGIALSRGEEEDSKQPTPPAPNIPTPGVARYRTVRLDNGLEVIIGNRPGMPLVTVGLALHGGSADTHPLGVAEVADLLTYPETTMEGAPRDFGLRMRNWVERDHVRYVLAGAAGNVGNMLAILAEQMSSMRTSDYAVQYYGEEVLPYIRSVEDWPELAAERDFRRALYGGHPYGQQATASDLERIKVDSIHAWLKQTHQPANGVVAIVGELDVDEVEKLAREWLGGWRATSQGAQALPAPPRPWRTASKPQFIVTERPGATQAKIQFGCLLPAADEAEATRYTLLAELAGTRLTQVLRHELGASYGFHGYTEVLRGGASHLVLRGTVDNAHLPQAIAALTQNVTELSKGTFRPGELESIRRQLLGRYAVSHGTSGALVASVLHARLLGWPLSAVDSPPAHLSAATEQTLSQDFSACTGGQVVLSVLGDPAVVRGAVQGLSSK